METELFEGQKEFETLFEVPDGVFYDPETGEYDCETGPAYSDALIQQGKLEAWQVMRATFPEPEEGLEESLPPLAGIPGQGRPVDASGISHVIWSIDQVMSREQLERVKRSLQEAFPSVQCVVIDGGATLNVIEPQTGQNGLLAGMPLMVGELVTCVENIVTMIELAEGSGGGDAVAVDPLREVVISQLMPGTMVVGKPVRYMAYFADDPAVTWPLVQVPGDHLTMGHGEDCKTH